MSEPFRIIYDRNRFPKRQRRADGTFGCRGCGAEIPSHRAWCGLRCKRLHHPTYVLMEVRKRDKDVCATCGFDCAASLNAWHKSYWEACNQDYNIGYTWKKENPRPHKPNYDHIVPFSEGGMTVLENMRTLCEPCHKSRTKLWHGDRAFGRKKKTQLDLL